MIPTRQEIYYRVFGAWRLARFDAGGAQYFDSDLGAAWRSFFAAALVAPAHILSLLLQVDIGGDVGTLPAFLVFLLSYSLEWTVFPVIVFQICQLIDREQAFFRYLTATNWSSVITFHLLLALTILVNGGAVPEALAPIVIFAVQVYILAYLWFITRHCLDVGGPAAAGFVALRFFIDVFIYAIATGLVS